MAKSTNSPTTATLMRFSINPNQLPTGFEIWTLDFPFGSPVWQFSKKVEGHVKNKIRGEYLGIPYRQLNNAIMAICPTLTHGFEKIGFEKGKPRRALAVGVPSAPAKLPDPPNIQHIIREWASMWTERSYIVKYIPEDERRTMRAALLEAINKAPADWGWKCVPVNKLRFNESLNYTALPSLLATLLHDKESAIHGKSVRWRKVQDSGSKNKKLSVVGFIGQHPIWTNYSIREFQMNKDGEGFFSYKIEFNLQTQAGRDAPWMFVSLHAQRYGHEALTHPNDRRRVSVLTAANRARLDDFPVDSTLVKLRTREINDNPEWDDNLAELLERIGATTLESPADIFATPQNFWRPMGHSADYYEDEYYIVHAEGYGYGENEAGHQLEAGFSMTDSSIVFDEVVSKHLTILDFDKQQELDDIPAPSGKKTPIALCDYTTWSRKPAMKPPAWGTQEERELERHNRYVQQRSEYQQIAARAIHRALRGENMFIIILWHQEDTYRGIYMALQEAFLLNPSDEFPPNVKIMDARINESLLSALDTSDTTYPKAHHQHMQEWRKFLQEKLPKHPNRYAIIETFGRKKSWGVKGAIREACVRENITSQMVETIRMKIDKTGKWVYVKGKRNHEHRANSVAHEVMLRHTGIMYDNLQEVSEIAGVREDNLEIVAFYLKQTQTNVKYPIAAKVAYDGAIEILLPDQEDWILYGSAAPVLGQIFADEWRNTVYERRKWKIRDEKREVSSLWYDNIKLSNFILRVLKNLQKPTIVVIEADTWRNYNIWPQLSNPNLPKNWNVLNFEPSDRIYERDDPQLKNLLAVIRMRTGRETPQYLTDTKQEFTKLTGAIDANTGDLMHYFSIGRQLVTGRGQRYRSTRYATMLDGVGAGVAYKYPQIVEFVPFFVREGYQSPDGLKQLCRIPHYLRISPAWPQGNIVSPYPMHLARQLVEDQLCILGMED